MSDLERFKALRKRLFSLIKNALDEDDYHKSYEGDIEVTAEYPNYFEDEEANESPSHYSIKLHCYVVGPYRHYDFHGETFEAALDKFEKFLNMCEGTE